MMPRLLGESDGAGGPAGGPAGGNASTRGGDPAAEDGRMEGRNMDEDSTPGTEQPPRPARRPSVVFVNSPKVGQPTLERKVLQGIDTDVVTDGEGLDEDEERAAARLRVTPQRLK